VRTRGGRQLQWAGEQSQRRGDGPLEGGVRAGGAAQGDAGRARPLPLDAWRAAVHLPDVAQDDPHKEYGGPGPRGARLLRRRRADRVWPHCGGPGRRHGAPVDVQHRRPARDSRRHRLLRCVRCRRPHPPPAARRRAGDAEVARGTHRRRRQQVEARLGAPLHRPPQVDAQPQLGADHRRRHQHVGLPAVPRRNHGGGQQGAARPGEEPNGDLQGLRERRRGHGRRRRRGALNVPEACGDSRGDDGGEGRMRWRVCRSRGPGRDVAPCAAPDSSDWAL